MWFAPLPLLWFALRSKWWTAAVTAVAVMMLGNLNIWSYFTKTLGMPGAAWVNIFLAAGVVFAGAVLLFSRAGIARRGAERGSCFAGGLGDERVCAVCNVATWVGRKSCAFAAEVSPGSAAGFDHGVFGG